jgi:hypothetical protein
VVVAWLDERAQPVNCAGPSRSAAAGVGAGGRCAVVSLDFWGKEDDGPGDDLFASDVEYQARRLRVLDAARQLVAAESQRPQRPPDAGTLAELLARPDEARWRVHGLLPAGGRLLITAQRKAGKTTLVGNIACSLLTGEPFLDVFDVEKLDGRLVVANYEVTGATFARWMQDLDVPAGRLYVVNLRGRRNLLATDDGRAELVDLVRAAEGEVLVVDPFGRADTGRSQNDAAEVTPWLVRLDEVAEPAGCSELVVTAHAGWDGERTRGVIGARGLARLDRDNHPRPGHR